MQESPLKSRAIAIAGALIFIGAFNYYSKSTHKKTQEVEVAEEADPAEVNSEKNSEAVRPNQNAQSAESVVAAPLSEKEYASKNLNPLLDQIASCLGVRPLRASDGASGDHVNIVGAFQNDLGEPNYQYEEWSNYFLQLSSGEMRKVRIEASTEGEGASGRFVKLYSVFQGRENFIPLSQEQSINPSDASVEALKSQGSFVKEEKSLRYYFATNEEINLIEENGIVTSVDMLKDGAAIRCTGLITEKMNCQCSGGQQ